MAKRFLKSIIVLACLVLTSQIKAQIIDSTFSHVGSSIPTLFIGGAGPTISSVSTCPDSIVAQIPANQWVYGVDISYTMTSPNSGNGWMSEQFSYVNCRTTGISESTISQGTGNTAGTQAYNRPSVNIANGLSVTGKLVFDLHAFRSWGNGSCDTTIAKVDSASWTITVSYGPAPTCFAPTNLNAGTILSNSADISWTTGGATNWQVRYDTVGFSPTNSSSPWLSSSAPSISLTGLMSASSYDVYVRDSCGVGNSSLWTGPLTITTLCTPLTAPFMESFSGAAWNDGTGWSNAGNTIDSCWSRDPQAPTGGGGGQPFAWGTQDGGTSTNNTGPSSDHTSGTAAGKYLYTEASGGGYQSNALVTSPLIDISALTSPSITFWRHMYGNNIGTLSLDVWTPSSGWQNSIWSHSGAVQTSSNVAWDSINVSLAGLSNDTIRVRFRGVRSFGNTGDMAIDDITFENGPTCPAPTGLVASNVGFTDATFSVTGTSSSYQLKGTQGTNSLIGTPFTGTSGSLAGASPGQTYDVFVRSICGPGDTSSWYGPITIQTLCAPVVPFSENFDATPWDDGSGVYNLNDALDPCWFRDPEGCVNSASPYSWNIRSDPPTTYQSPSQDVSGTGNFAYTESSSGLTGQVAYLRMPPVNVSSLTTPALTFSYHAFGNSMGSLAFQVWTPLNGWGSSTQVFSGAQQTAANAPWKDTTFTLSATSDTIMVRFVATRGNGNQSDLAIDEVGIVEAPTCPDPYNLSVTAGAASSVTLSWTTGGAAMWNIAYGQAGSVSFMPFTTAATNPFTLTGLTPGTSYEFYVRDSCGSGDVSNWVGPVTFNTPCATVAAPYSEDFDLNFDEGNGWSNSGSTVDICWSRTPSTGTGTPWWNQPYHWGGGSGTTPSGNTGPSSDHTSGSGSYAYIEASGGNGTSADLFTPIIDLDTLSNPELVFWKHQYGNQMGTFSVAVSVNGGAYSTIHTSSGDQGNSWIQVKVALSAASLGDSIQLRFRGQKPSGGGSGRGDVAIDDITIDNAPACPAPTLLTATPLTGTSIQLAWTGGGASNWMIEYGPSGFTQGAGTMVAAATNPFTVTGLLTQTGYDFYVKDSCSASSTSTWDGPASALTLCGTLTAPYSEDFEGSQWVDDPGGFNYGSVDTCWNRDNISPSGRTYWWRPGTGTTPSNFTGPTGDHTSGSGKYLYTESFSGATSTTIISPTIDLDTLSTPELRFWYHMYGSLIDSMAVKVETNSAITHLFSLSGQQQANSNAAWMEAVIDLTSFVGDEIRVHFVGYRSPGNQNRADITIDDVTIDNAPPCSGIPSLQVTATTTTTGTVSWSSSFTGSFEINYGLWGGAPGSGTTIPVTTSPTIITGLNPGTTYFVSIRRSCPSSSSFGSWSPVDTLTTQCATIIAPHTENFDINWNPGPNANNAGGYNGGSTIGACWTRTPASGGTTSATAVYHWGGSTGGTPTGNTGPSADHTSGFGNYALTEASYTPFEQIAYLISPAIDISGLPFPELRFWYHMDGTTINSLRIDFQNVNGSWVSVDSLVGAQGNSWQERVISIPQSYGPIMKVRFKARKQNVNQSQSCDIAIDDFSISSAPTCPDPSNILATPLNATSTLVTWTGGGSGTAIIEYGLSGFTPGSGTKVTTTSNPYTLTGLVAGGLYDIYVQDSCGANDYSNAVGPTQVQLFTCSNGCQYTLELTDANSNGWVSNWQGTTYHELNVTVGTTSTPYTLTSGGSALFSLNVCDGDTIRLRFINTGFASGQVGWYLMDSSGDTVTSQAPVGNGILTTGYKYNGSAVCSNTCPTPVASFTLAQNGLTIDLDGSTSTGTSLTHIWTFGDGNSGSGPITNHSYANDGAYDVQLLVMDQCGQKDSLIQSITACDTLISPFTYTLNQFQADFVSGLDSSYTSIVWDFGDGQTSNIADPTNIYAVGGSYYVSLSAVNLCGDSLSVGDSLEICTKPIAEFTWFIVSSTASGMLVQFDGTSSVNANTFTWYWGDGTSSTGANFIQHLYSVPSLNYTVTLVISNQCALGDTVSHTLNETDIDESIIADRAQIYPNPKGSSQRFTVSGWTSNSNASYEVVDGYGRLLYQGEFETNSIGDAYLPDFKLPAGIYRIRIVGDDRRQNFNVAITQ